jgi:hypothetical protein
MTVTPTIERGSTKAMTLDYDNCGFDNTKAAEHPCTRNAEYVAASKSVYAHLALTQVTVLIAP